jgi:hypothetical protein
MVLRCPIHDTETYGGTTVCLFPFGDEARKLGRTHCVRELVDDQPLGRPLQSDWPTCCVCKTKVRQAPVRYCDECGGAFHSGIGTSCGSVTLGDEPEMLCGKHVRHGKRNAFVLKSERERPWYE